MGNLTHFCFRTNPPPSLSQEEVEVFGRLLTDYFNNIVGRRLTLSAVKQRLCVCEGFVTFCNVPPWSATPNHFNQWCSQLSKRNLTPQAQRVYRGVVRDFFRFLACSTTLIAFLQEKGLSIETVIAISETGGDMATIR